VRGASRLAGGVLGDSDSRALAKRSPTDSDPDRDEGVEAAEGGGAGYVNGFWMDDDDGCGLKSASIIVSVEAPGRPEEVNELECEECRERGDGRGRDSGESDKHPLPSKFTIWASQHLNSFSRD